LGDVLQGEADSLLIDLYVVTVIFQVADRKLRSEGWTWNFQGDRAGILIHNDKPLYRLELERRARPGS
jgi:hypothetical protein